MNVHWLLVAGAVLVVASLSAAATTLRAMTRIWMRHWVEAQLAPGAAGRFGPATYLAESHHLLAVATSAAAFVIALTGAFVGATAEDTGVALIARLLLLVLAFLLLGQALPRAIARRWAPALAMSLLPILRLAAWLLAPVMWLAGAPTSKLRGPGPATPVERGNLGELLREGEFEGIGEPRELEFISEVVEFGEKPVSAVMTPRTAVMAVDRALTPRQMARQVAESGFSRVPVYQHSLDEIVGIVHGFDVLATAGERWPELRPVVHVPAGKRCSELLFEMLAQQQHFAVVLDEHGGTVGIVTLEDLLEELVGDIRDEHDAAPALAAAGLRAAVVDATTPVADIAARFDVSLVPGPHERAESLGGLLTRRLGRIPLAGERVRLAGLEITVVEAEPARALRLLVQRAPSLGVIDLDVPR